MLWIIILILVLAAAGSGLIYLCSRFGKFTIIEQLSKGNKIRRILLEIIPVIIIMAVVCIILDFINAIICLLHLIAFWLLSDLALWFIKKIRKK